MALYFSTLSRKRLVTIRKGAGQLQFYICIVKKQIFFYKSTFVTMRANIKLLDILVGFHYQGSHRYENYLNLEGFLEKSLKIKSALKSTGKSLKGLEKSLNSSIFCRT